MVISYLQKCILSIISQCSENFYNSFKDIFLFGKFPNKRRILAKKTSPIGLVSVFIMIKGIELTLIAPVFFGHFFDGLIFLTTGLDQAVNFNQ